MTRLPPLGSMEAFLEVARHGTVKAAASELGLSMPALSRRIQTLEHAVGRPLFDRHHQGLKLTEAGRTLQTQLAPILDELRGVIGRVGSPDASLRLHLNVLPLFAQQRLFPRLPELRRQHPELHIDIDTLSHGEARLGDGLDAAIALARAIDPALYAARPDQDKIFPISARAPPDRERPPTVPEPFTRLPLNVLPLFAQQRLFPRLPELRRQHPELHIDIDTLSHGEARLGDGLDAAIALARAIDPALYAARLDQDKIFPIAARDLTDGERPITVPEQLQRLTILLHREMPETFAEWRQAIRMPYLEPAGIDFFDSGPLLLAAAADRKGGGTGQRVAGRESNGG